MTTRDYTLRQRIAAVVPQWLNELDQHKGDRAALRRAQVAADVYAIEMAHRLSDRLHSGSPRSDSAFFLAALLAHLRNPKARALIHTLVDGASEGKPETALLKPQRFAQLLRVDALPDRLRLFRRVLQLAQGEADALDLTFLFLTWSENATKREFARHYFAPRNEHDGEDDSAAAPIHSAA